MVDDNCLAVLDPTVVRQPDEMLVDMSSGVFNSIYARLNGAAAALLPTASRDSVLSAFHDAFGGGSIKRLRPVT